MAYGIEHVYRINLYLMSKATTLSKPVGDKGNKM